MKIIEEKKCPNCQQRIPLRRVISGLGGKAFQCPQCQTWLHVEVSSKSQLSFVFYFLYFICFIVQVRKHWLIAVPVGIGAILFLPLESTSIVEVKVPSAEQTHSTAIMTKIAVRLLGVLSIYGGICTMFHALGNPFYLPTWMVLVEAAVGFICSLGGLGVLLLKDWGRKCIIAAAVILIVVLFGLYAAAYRLHLQTHVSTDEALSWYIGHTAWRYIGTAVRGMTALSVGVFWLFHHPKMRAQFRS